MRLITEAIEDFRNKGKLNIGVGEDLETTMSSIWD